VGKKEDVEDVIESCVIEYKTRDIAIGEVDGVRIELSRWVAEVHAKVFGSRVNWTKTFLDIEKAQKYFEKLKEKYNLTRPG